MRSGAGQRPTATRSAGVATRAAILSAARGLFASDGLGGVSVAAVATRADVFPSQVTYYFGDKESLFVEAACRELLALANDVEAAGRATASPEEWARVTVEVAVTGPRLLMFVEAMLLSRQRSDVVPRLRDTLARLHSEGERAMRERMTDGGWTTRTSPAVEARAFWATVLGTALERTVLAVDQAAGSAAVSGLLALNLYPTDES